MTCLGFYVYNGYIFTKNTNIWEAGTSFGIGQNINYDLDILTLNYIQDIQGK